MESTQKLTMRLHKSTRQPIHDCKAIIDEMPEQLREPYVEYYENNPRSWFIDPIELDPNFQKIVKEVDLEVASYVTKEKEERIKRQKDSGLEFMGFKGLCHFEWKVKKEILMKKHGISWKSPREMNNNVVFD